MEPNADIRTAAATMRQFFIAYMESGFTEVQAMQLLVGMLAQSGKKE